MRIVEKNGDKLEDILTKSDPFGEDKCNQETCLLCQTTDKEKGQCKIRNIVYKIECTRCKKEGKQSTYWGETARNAQLRGKEHVKDLETQRDGSHMMNHLNSEHQGQGTDEPAQESFSMKVHRRYRTPLERQLGEALNIAKGGGPGAEGIMNQKEEYSRCVVPELEVTEGWRDSAKLKRNREPETTQGRPPHKKQ